MRFFLMIVALLPLLSACGNPVSEPNPTQPAGTHSHGGGHHGAITSLGTVQIAGNGFAVARHGVCEPGKEAAFVMTPLEAAEHPPISLWIEDPDGKQISAGATNEHTGGDLHFHARPKGNPARLAIQSEGETDVSYLDLRSKGAPTHDGIAAPLVNSKGDLEGWIELKLHDDKGDLELWISTDGEMKTPLDLPIASTLSILFQSHDKKLVQLRPRNTDQNEDEGGTANNRGGQTNYFIFPGDTGTDAKWLMGHSFRGIVSVAFERGGKPLQTDLFVLTPHTHGAQGHQH